ncbi:LacI family transcriptional regulator [Streptomyces vinaceus]|uniref:LacI family transcriptional regulator n=1 Tax=Streptomyces vinaceus TaxID=1960 RepID=A0A5J6JIJ7_STRVI|nr:LacI family DNA-binding transcriptional regulator [Streptomyces vinaceus]QEV47308.1 LacI family transcriptional regulator [Streptomyces vinaceus]GHE40991.1 LacI family transcriptional regulator [Streptomyces vinaceus]
MSGHGRRGGRPTLEEVAARAGVGRGTVSRVVNGASGVSERTRAAVEAAVEELGYVPNRAARALASNRADAVALVVPEPQSRFFAEPYFSDMVRGVGAALAETDVQLVLTLAGSDRERRRLARYLAAHRVDGVLLVGVHAEDPLPELLAGLGIPAVVSGRRSAAEPLPYVDCDNLAGAAGAVGHLLDRGRRAVATVTGPLDVYGARCRLDGYREALTAAGLPVDGALIAHGDFTEEGGRRAVRELLERRPDLDAVFAASDVTALGARRELRAAGRLIPGDVALVGFDDSVAARHMEPPLTSVRQPVEEMGRTMAHILLARMAGEPGDEAVVLPTELVVRESS